MCTKSFCRQAAFVFAAGGHNQLDRIVADHDAVVAAGTNRPAPVVKQPPALAELLGEIFVHLVFIRFSVQYSIYVVIGLPANCAFLASSSPTAMISASNAESSFKRCLTTSSVAQNILPCGRTSCDGGPPIQTGYHKNRQVLDHVRPCACEENQIVRKTEPRSGRRPTIDRPLCPVRFFGPGH